MPLEKSVGDAHNVFSKNVSQIVLSANDDKRIQTPGGVIYPSGAGSGRVCKEELTRHPKIQN